jgi:hypothetical protein
MIASCLFGLFWLALLPFQVNQAIELDETRRIALLLTPIALIGMSLGPFIVSLAVRAGDVTGGFWAAASLLVLGGLLYASASFRTAARRAAC